MALIRFISQSSILASTLFTGCLIYSNPAHANTYCIVTDNGKTMCGKPTSIPRMCIRTGNGNNACGKFIDAKKEDESQNQISSEQISNIYQGSSYRKEIKNFIFVLKDCRRSDANVICSFVVSNKGNEAGFGIGSGQITDFTGKSYGFRGAEIGNSRIGDSGITIAPGINYNGTFTVGVPEGINQVPLMKINTSLGTFQYRNIAFSN